MRVKTRKYKKVRIVSARNEGCKTKCITMIEERAVKRYKQTNLSSINSFSSILIFTPARREKDASPCVDEKLTVGTISPKLQLSYKKCYIPQLLQLSFWTQICEHGSSNENDSKGSCFIRTASIGSKSFKFLWQTSRAHPSNSDSFIRVLPHMAPDQTVL